MAKRIGRNRNTVTETSMGTVSVDSITTAVVVGENLERIGLVISNPNNQSCWIKEQAASVDNDKKGYYVIAGGKFIVPTDNVYTGEVSAIFNSGGSKTLYFVER